MGTTSSSRKKSTSASKKDRDLFEFPRKTGNVGVWETGTQTETCPVIFQTRVLLSYVHPVTESPLGLSGMWFTHPLGRTRQKTKGGGVPMVPKIPLPLSYIRPLFPVLLPLPPLFRFVDRRIPFFFREIVCFVDSLHRPWMIKSRGKGGLFWPGTLRKGGPSRSSTLERCTKRRLPTGIWSSFTSWKLLVRENTSKDRKVSKDRESPSDNTT